MAAGWQVGAQCLASIDLAGAQACASAYGVTSSGLLSCTSFTVSGADVHLTMSTGAVVSVTPQPCDRITFADTWGPLFGAIFFATVVIWGAMRLIEPFRRHDDV